MEQSFSVKGRVRIEVKEGDRSVFLYEGPNLITHVGIAQLAGLWNGDATGAARYIALGTGVAPADVADTALGTEVTFGGGERRLADTIDRVTDTVTDDTAQLVAEFAITQGFTLSEIGLLTAASAGVLVAHHVFAGVAVSIGQTVFVTWSLTLAAA